MTSNRVGLRRGGSRLPAPGVWFSASIAIAAVGWGGVACSSANSASPVTQAEVDARAKDSGSSSCTQALLGYVPPATKATIASPRPPQPYYQWESNNGYCGEVSLLQAGMSNGIWASQYNVRLLCGLQSQGDDGFPAGTPLSQSGPEGYCAANVDAMGVATADYASQLLLDVGDPAAGKNSVLTCANNAGLSATTFTASAALDGEAAFEEYVSWIKSEVIAGHAVTAGVIEAGGTSTDYDHIVSLASIGTNHAVNDASFYADDVLYFEDHGAYTFEGSAEGANPAIPPGAAADVEGCTPYLYGVRVGDLAQSRESFDALTTGQPYAFVIPDRNAGGGSGPILNYGLSVSGPLDDDGVTKPVLVTIQKSSTDGVENPVAPLAGYNYEAPYIGSADDGSSCTNDPPKSWMDLELGIQVQGLTAGESYTLYRYVFDAVKPKGNASPVGTNVALAVPRSGFNAHKDAATSSITFVADGTTYTETMALRSDHVAVFRAVPVGAP